MPPDRTTQRSLSRLLQQNLRDVTGLPSARVQYSLQWKYENKYHVSLDGYPKDYKLIPPSTMTQQQITTLLDHYDAGILRFVCLGEEGLRKVRDGAVAKGIYSPKPRKVRTDRGYPHRQQAARHIKPPKTRESMTAKERAVDVVGPDCLKVQLQGAWMDKKKRWNLMLGCTCKNCRARKGSRY